MLFFPTLSAAAGLGLVTFSAAQGTWPTNLVGTWTTKSHSTLTGPGFYDPVADKLIEPAHTGISYSFTADGHYEESYFRAISNPVNPQCPGGIMQWQHGSWVMHPNGSLTLTPIAVDGRQLYSDCNSGNYGIYTRYNQSELMKAYEQYTDPYHNVPRLDLFKFDGSPLPPMYLVYSPPQMLPTTTLHPTSATATGSSKAKRDLPESNPLRLSFGPSSSTVYRINPDRLWWVGVAFTGLGGLLYFGPQRMGIRL